MRMLLAALGAAAVIAAPGREAAAYRHSAESEAAQAARRAEMSRRHVAPADHPDSGAEMIGRPAPDWTFTRWIGPPQTLQSFRGRVVLLRWWTEGCHFCAATLPELEDLRHRYAGAGLVVVGVFHPKPPREVSNRKIVATAKKLGFTGPIAVDREWKTLERYWLAGHDEHSWTSVSFLIDREGRIQWVHGGGEYHATADPAHARCDTQYAELEQALVRALAGRAPAVHTP